MQVEIKKKVVETVEGATITLSNKEVRMLLDLVGNIGGEGEMRDFTNSLYNKLGGGNHCLKSTDPFLTTTQFNGGYKPKGF